MAQDSWYRDRGAELYDLAFSWDVEEEAAWLRQRFGPYCGSVLELGCGSGRMLPPLARAGLEVGGVDSSTAMLARARSRLLREGLPEPTLIRADMAHFDMDRTFDAAFSTVATMSYLLDADRTSTHLQAVAAHLNAGGRYLVQLPLAAHALDASRGPIHQRSEWEAERGGDMLRTTWWVTSFDPVSKVKRARIRFEVLAGQDAGKVYEFDEENRSWDWEEWAALVRDSPFVQVAAYDGDEPDRPSLHLGPTLDGHDLLWHELELRHPKA